MKKLLGKDESSSQGVKTTGISTIWFSKRIILDSQFYQLLHQSSSFCSRKKTGQSLFMYLFLKKTFDKVPHKRHLQKLGFGGAHRRQLKCILKYLEGKQRTINMDTVSSWKGASSSVPQCSLVPPIMFLIYIRGQELLAHGPDPAHRGLPSILQLCLVQTLQLACETLGRTS